jgi:IPT/TIG domain/Fibronectin type III domain/Cysteine-rich secretory protein family
VTTISKHVFRVLAGPARRRLVAGALGALVLGILPILPAGPLPQVHLTTTPAAAGPWLDRLNTWRASSGLPNLTENTVYSAGDYNHSVYMVKNDEVAHSEVSTHPYYTVAGDTAAQNSNIEVSSTTSTTDSQAIDWWMGAPMHAMSMMDPMLASTGFGAYRQVKSGWQAGWALDVNRGRLTSGGTYPMFFPGNGSTEPLRTFGGGEFPDPLQACTGYTAPTGLPVIVEVGSNVATTAGSVHSFTGNGVTLQHCVIDSGNTALGSMLKWHGAVVLIPKAPLQNGVTYTVALTVNGVPRTWSFTVGATLLPPLSITGVSPNKGPVAGGTSVTINGTGFATGVTGVMFGATPAASFSVVNDATISAVSPAHAAGAVDVSVTATGGSSATSVADRYTYGLGAPTAVVAASGDQSATVTWNAPSYDGGSPITSYSVSGTPGGSQTLICPCGTPLQAVVSGLTNGTLYTFTVTATTAVESGPASLPSSAVMPMKACTSTSPTPDLVSVSNNEGPLAGGTTVTITGSSFCNGLTVSFGSTPAARVTVVSDTSVVAVSPAHAAGVLDVRVTTAGGITPISPVDKFTFTGAKYCATFENLIRAPRTWIKGQAQTFTVTVSNCGTAIWPATGLSRVDLNLHFTNRRGGSVTAAYWLTRTSGAISRNLGTNRSTIVTIRLTPNFTSSGVWLESLMRKEGSYWFDQATTRPTQWSAVFVTVG